MKVSNILVVSAGHNGLVCAFYLAARGLKVKIAEKRAVGGGGAVTEEFHPGFRNSLAAYPVILLNSKVIADMNLSAHGLTVSVAARVQAHSSPASSDGNAAPTASA
jgi:phytoene dehydrogenase-like protein